MGKAKIAESRIKGLSKTYGLPPALVRRIQVAAVKSVALFGTEIRWKTQKTYQNEIQKLINKQARSITGMYPTTLIAALMSESGLIPAHIMSDFRQGIYAYRLHFQNLYRPKISFPLPYEEGMETHNQRINQSWILFGQAINILQRTANN